MPDAHDDASARQWTAGALIGDTQLTLFQKTLLLTDGTLTDLVAVYAGAPVHARRLDQHLAPDPAGSGAQLLHRRIVLADAADTPWVYAESQFIFDRLPRSVQHGLLHTERPIGMLWREARLEMMREVVDRRRELDARAAQALQVEPGTPLLARTYRIVHTGEPVGQITEKFAVTRFR